MPSLNIRAHYREMRRQHSYYGKSPIPFWRFYLAQSWYDWTDHHVYAYDEETGQWYKRFTWKSQERW